MASLNDKITFEQEDLPTHQQQQVILYLNLIQIF
jgi:hypothetical protein